MMLKSRGPIPIDPGAKLKIAILIMKTTSVQKLFITFFLRNHFSSKCTKTVSIMDYVSPPAIPHPHDARTLGILWL
jgi:hypothetical protein